MSPMLQAKVNCISILGHERRFYVGEYVPFDAFHFENLRTLDGW
jgi:hypothetical protein